jgi:Tfp pilus assembly protein PilE
MNTKQIALILVVIVAMLAAMAVSSYTTYLGHLSNQALDISTEMQSCENQFNRRRRIRTKHKKEYFPNIQRHKRQRVCTVC